MQVYHIIMCYFLTALILPVIISIPSAELEKNTQIKTKKKLKLGQGKKKQRTGNYFFALQFGKSQLYSVPDSCEENQTMKYKAEVVQRNPCTGENCTMR